MTEPSNIIEDFSDIYDVWESEISVESVRSRMYDNPNYKKLLEMGEIAIPLWLNKLQKDPNYGAINALEKLTGRCFSGNFKEMTQQWIKWGHENGMLVPIKEG